MQRMSRAQRLLLIYLIWKSHEFEKELWKPRGGAGGTSLRIHGNEYHSPDFYSCEADIPVLTDAKYPNALLLGGSRKMTDNLDMDGNQIDIGADLSLIPSGTTLKVWNRAGTAARAVDIGNLFIRGYVRSYVWDTAIQTTSAGAAGTIHVESWDGATYKTVIIWTAGLCRIPRGGNITMLDQKMLIIGTYTDAQRPAAGTAGRVIFNTDDGMPNYDDGTNWRDINGNIT